MKYYRTILFVLSVLLVAWMPARVCAYEITAADFYSHQIEGLQSQTTNSLLVDDYGFVWISNSNGIDRYDGMNVQHYKLSNLGMRSYRDGMMILMHKDMKGRIWAFTERGNIYQFDEAEDAFRVVVDLYSFEKWSSVQTLYATAENRLVIGVNNGIIVYDLNTRSIVSHRATNCDVRSIIPLDESTLVAGSNAGAFLVDAKTGVPDTRTILLKGKSVTCLKRVGDYLWAGTRGKGLCYMPVAQLDSVLMVPGSSDVIVNALSYDEDYGMLVATDGYGLRQLDIDAESGGPSSGLRIVASDTKDAVFLTRSGGINDVMVDRGYIWFTMHMGGCMRLEPHHSLATLYNPEAESPSDNFVYDLDNGPDGSLWVAFNQAIVRYRPDGSEPQVYMNHQSHFLTVKVMPDSSVWAGGFGTGLHHFDPETGAREWFSSVADAPVNDCVYDLHDTPDGDLWVGGLNFPLTRLHFLPDGKIQKRYYPELTQVSDVESLDEETLAVATSDGIWLLNIETEECSHHFMVGEEYGWKGSNFVRSITTRNNREIWIATAGSGLVCYDVPTDHYDYYDNLDILPSLELRSVLMLNDSILCASTENNGVFSFNCNSRRTMRSLLQEDEILSQEFLQNSGYRLPNGTLLFGGDRGGVLLTADEAGSDMDRRQIFILGPKTTGKDYMLSYRHRNLFLSFCTNDIYHQDDYRFEYRIEGFSDDWLPTDGARTLRLINLPTGQWDLELRAINSTGLVLPEVLHLHVSRPIWQRWYAWVTYIVLFFYLVLKIVLYLVRPRIEDM